MVQCETENGLSNQGLREHVPNRDGNVKPYIHSLLSYAKWLHILESDEILLGCEVETRQNLDWCKALLARWREAGYPNPEQWPETVSAYWLHPSYSLNHSKWPDFLKG